MHYSVNLNSHAGSVCLQTCVLNQPLEVEMLRQYVLVFVLKLPFRLNVYLLLLMGGRGEGGARLFPVVFSDRTQGHGHKQKYWKWLLNVSKDSLLCGWSKTSQSGCGVPILGDIQNLPGHCPGTAAVAAPA